MMLEMADVGAILLTNRAPVPTMMVPTRAGRAKPNRSSRYPIRRPPKPEPINWSEKAKDGTARGQPNSAAIGLRATTTRYMPPALIASSQNEAMTTVSRLRPMPRHAERVVGWELGSKSCIRTKALSYPLNRAASASAPRATSSRSMPTATKVKPQSM